jgi:hypothetical protein
MTAGKETEDETVETVDDEEEPEDVVVYGV